MTLAVGENLLKKERAKQLKAVACFRSQRTKVMDRTNNTLMIYLFLKPEAGCRRNIMAVFGTEGSCVAAVLDIIEKEISPRIA